MKITLYLIINENGRVRSTKGRPSMEMDEIAIQVALTIPRTLFQRPRLRTAIEIPELEPVTIDAEVIDSIQEIVLRETGIPITLEIVDLAPPEEIPSE